MPREIKPVLNVADLTLERWTQGALYESADASFGRLLGLSNLGISYNEVPPGKSSCPFHNHHVEDELFFVIEGTGEYRFGSERYPIKKGDTLGAPAGGKETAHQILNTGTHDADLSWRFDDGEDGDRRVPRLREISCQD